MDWIQRVNDTFAHYGVSPIGRFGDEFPAELLPHVGLAVAYRGGESTHVEFRFACKYLKPGVNRKECLELLEKCAPTQGVGATLKKPGKKFSHLLGQTEHPLCWIMASLLGETLEGDKAEVVRAFTPSKTDFSAEMEAFFV